MNDDVAGISRALCGFDPIDLFGTRRDEASQKQFLDFRAELARRMEEEWLACSKACAAKSRIWTWC